MDISAIVIVIMLTALFLGAIVWMEMHSRKRRSIEDLREAKSSEINRKRKAIYENR